MTACRASVLRIVVLAPVAAVLLAAGGAGPASAAPADGPARSYRISTTFSSQGGQAVTYDPARVPVGAGVRVGTRSADGVTTTTLQVRGLQPNTTYGAHAHVNRCGATGEAAGPHLQFRPDPVQPSVDPAYANPRNEIWLDLTTDARGEGTATSTVAWMLPAERSPRSVVLHDMATTTGPGAAGTAGGRSACVDVRF